MCSLSLRNLVVYWTQSAILHFVTGLWGKKTPQILIYQSQSQICIDCKVVGCHMGQSQQNPRANHNGQRIANKSTYSAGPGWGVSEPCACGTELLQKKFTVESEMNLKRCALNLGESMCARRHTHSTQPCCFSLFCPCANFPKTKPWLRWIPCPMII